MKGGADGTCGQISAFQSTRYFSLFFRLYANSVDSRLGVVDLCPTSAYKHVVVLGQRVLHILLECHSSGIHLGESEITRLNSAVCCRALLHALPTFIFMAGQEERVDLSRRQCGKLDAERVVFLTGIPNGRTENNVDTLNAPGDAAVVSR